jgi:hypothetical protein
MFYQNPSQVIGIYTIGSDTSCDTRASRLSAAGAECGVFGLTVSKTLVFEMP